MEKAEIKSCGMTVEGCKPLYTKVPGNRFHIYGVKLDCSRENCDGALAPCNRFVESEQELKSVIGAIINRMTHSQIFDQLSDLYKIKAENCPKLKEITGPAEAA